METPLAPGLDQDHQQEENNKVTVISLSDTVAHPGTVVVEGPDTAVTPGAVLGPHRLTLQTSPAELGWEEALLLIVLHQLHHPPQLLRLARLDEPGVLAPTLEVAVPDGDSEEDDGEGLTARHLRSNVDQPAVIHPHLEAEVDPYWSQAHKPGRDLIKISLKWLGAV